MNKIWNEYEKVTYHAEKTFNSSESTFKTGTEASVRTVQRVIKLVFNLTRLKFKNATKSRSQRTTFEVRKGAHDLAAGGEDS